MGPKARDVLQAMTEADLSNEAFPFGTAQTIELGTGLVRAHRITYVGELGWELYMPTEFARSTFDTVMAAGEPHGLRLVGMHAMDSLRIEKAYRHFGHDIGDEDHVLEAGLGFAVKTDKAKGRFGDFIGREGVLAKRQARIVEAAGAVPAENIAAAALPQRGDPQGRQGRQPRDVRCLRPSSRRRDRAGLHPVQAGRDGGAVACRPL